MKNKYKIFKLLCVFISIILVVGLFITKVPTFKLMPFILLNLAVYDIIKHNENKGKNNYKKYDGMKVVIFSIMVFWCLIIAMGIVHSLVSLT
ncbi:hypothetical protein SDC9_94632 [bioreactor metagenome]|uniref:Uncharacterized protein n=1 Tax=bioreactor metagenome TaxID=1076179 RepID=A0A645A6L3_9ZZZZ